MLGLDRHDAALGEVEAAEVLDDLGLRRDRVRAAAAAARSAIGLAGKGERVSGGVIACDQCACPGDCNCDGQLNFGDIDPFVAAPVAMGVTLGAMAGSRVLARTSNRILRYVFVGILLIVSAQMIWRGLM